MRGFMATTSSMLMACLLVAGWGCRVCSALLEFSAPSQGFEQQLDHFDPSSTKTFTQSYWVDASAARDQSPVFLVLGDFSSISSCLTSDVITSATEKYGATVFALETRFFSENVPLTQMQYLSVEQALNDVVEFHKFVTTTFQPSPSSDNWVVLGCGFGGSLAAWSRMRHPNIFSAAVTSGSPFHAALNFYEFDIAVAKVLGKSCTKALGAATRAALNGLINTSTAKSTRTDFGCPTDLTTPDVMYVLADIMASTVMAPGDDFVQGSFCEKIIKLSEDPNTSEADYREEWKALTDEWYSTTQSQCCDFSLSEDCLGTKGSMQRGTTQYFWLQCSELGLFQSAAGQDGVRSQVISTPWFLQQCNATFNDPDNGLTLYRSTDPDMDMLYSKFGGSNLAATNILVIVGGNDPLAAASIHQANTLSMTVLVVEGAAHCETLTSSQNSHSDDDDDEGLSALGSSSGSGLPGPKTVSNVAAARKVVLDHFSVWLKEEGQCPLGCVNGDCNLSNICECTSGYTGVSCDQEVESDFNPFLVTACLSLFAVGLGLGCAISGCLCRGGKKRQEVTKEGSHPQGPQQQYLPPHLAHLAHGHPGPHAPLVYHHHPYSSQASAAPVQRHRGSITPMGGAPISRQGSFAIPAGGHSTNYASIGSSVSQMPPSAM